jgi:hypothetical protein
MSVSKLHASISVVLPRTSVAVVVPAAEADLDATGRYKYVSDQAVVMLDRASLLSSKTVNHSVVVDTTTTLDFAKNPSDSISFSEHVVRVLIFIRDFTDSAPATDAVGLLLAANKSDFVSLADSRSLTPHKFSFDAVTVPDSLLRGVTKNTADTVTPVELVAVSYQKLADDTFSISDIQAYSFTKSVLDVATLLDAALASVDKFLSDGVSANDMFDITDGSTYVFAKSISDVTMLSETVSATFQKVVGDQAGLSDSGVAVIQSYSDITYFFEDYVGTRTLF